jgi:hypothetical protein
MLSMKAYINEGDLLLEDKTTGVTVFASMDIGVFAIRIKGEYMTLLDPVYVRLIADINVIIYKTLTKIVIGGGSNFAVDNPYMKSSIDTMVKRISELVDKSLH